MRKAYALPLIVLGLAIMLKSNSRPYFWAGAATFAFGWYFYTLA